MSEAGFVELADAASGVHVWLGSGLPGLGEGEVLAFAVENGALLAAGVDPSGDFDLADASISARAALDAAEVEGQAGGEGGSITLRREGDERQIDASAIGGPAPDAKRAKLLRILGVLPGPEGDAVTASAVRSEKAKAHDAEALRAQVVGDDGAHEVLEPLLSTQYDAGGGHQRAGLELWIGAEDNSPLRVAGLRRLEFSLPLAGGWDLRAAPYAWSLQGGTTAGSYLIWRRASG